MKNTLKQHRLKAELSLQKLADMYGGTKSHCWALERGANAPTLPTAYALAKVLGVEVYDLWPDETEIIEESVLIRRIRVKDKRIKSNA